jgi:Polyketide cyclase / dehydrase and lipid transport
MASIRKEIVTSASADHVWAAVRDVGALHTRLVPGFVVNTTLDGRDRIVTFNNGLIARESILEINEDTRRVAWAVVGGALAHYNASAQVSGNRDGSATVVWIADFLPDEAAPGIERMMNDGAAAMKSALDRLPSVAASTR